MTMVSCSAEDLKALEDVGWASEISPGIYATDPSLSLAISVKRIADALERQNEHLQRIAEGVYWDSVGMSVVGELSAIKRNLEER